MFSAFNRLPIGRRLSLIVSIITLLTLISVVYVALVSTTQTVRAERARALLEQNEATAFRIDNRLARVSQIMDAIGDTVRLEDGETLSIADARRAIDTIMRFETDLIIRRIVLYSPDLPVMIYNFFDISSGRNILVNSVNTASLPSDIWFIEAFESGVYGWYGPHTFPLVTTNDPLLSLAIPIIPRGTDVPLGVLWADVSVNTVESLLRESSLFERIVTRESNAYNFIVSNTGDLIARFNVRQRPPEVLTDLLSRITDPARPEFYTTTQDQNPDPLYIVNVPMSGTGWRMVTVMEDEVLTALPSETVVQVIAFSALGLLTLVVTVGYFIRRWLSVPLVELSSAAMEIGSGDMRRVILYQSLDDEVGQLARALDDMRSNLRYSYDTLEQRIQRRTAELNIARLKAQSTAEELRAVYDESLSVVSEYQLRNILETFTDRIMRLLKADFCGVWLLRSSGEELRAVAHTLSLPVDQVPYIRVGMGLVGMTVANAQPMILDHYSTWEHRLSNMTYAEGVERALCVPLISSGKSIGAVLVGRFGLGDTFDVNQQRLLELFANMVSPSVRNAQLYVQLDEARREADRANLVKTRFLASVTHELRTPLNLIINNMDFMRIGTFGEITDEQDMRLGQTIRSAEHLLYLINDLLDVSKIDAGEMQLFIQPTDLSVVIEDVIDSALMQIEKESKDEVIRLRVDMPDSLPQVPMDARRIRQVLYNLLSNAIKFTLEGEVRLEVRLEDERVRFTVSDTGIGIPESERENLFQPFERMSNAKNMGIEGTGLGLPISKHLVEQHGGELTYITRVGIGTSFTFNLPINHLFDGKHSTSANAVTITDLSEDTQPIGDL